MKSPKPRTMSHDALSHRVVPEACKLAELLSTGFNTVTAQIEHEGMSGGTLQV
jgi:hypothetical protein